MKKNILISIDHPLVSAILFDDGKETDRITWEDDNNLSLNLLEKIDKLLMGNDLEIEEINEIKVDSLQTTYSSTRIAKILANTTNYYLTNCQKNVE